MKKSRISLSHYFWKYLTLLFWVGGMYFVHSAGAQITNNQRCRWVKTGSGSFQLDSLSVFPESIQIRQPQNSGLKVLYNLNTRQAELSGESSVDSVLVCYRVFPLDLAQKSFNRDIAVYDSTHAHEDDYYWRMPDFVEKREELFDLNGIQKSGNITRGVSFGNTQNVFVNSALNLQLDGQLTNDISILASISDQNVPFQPEGNTLQLQEFDRVFVQLSHRLGSLTVGDIVLRQNPGYFLKYYKNVQGANLETHYTVSKNSKAATSVGVAVSKGKFASLLIDPIEGVQGPYRLTGLNNEQFIIVLANSEKVFIDGKQLNRGFDNDYVIDYNRAEVTFNTNIIITRFTRIRVDFEYSERNYSRTILTGSHYQNYKKLDFFVNLYQASDNPRTPLLDLSDEDKQALSEVGDNPGVISGIRENEEFNSSLVLYKQIDSTTISGSVYTGVLVYSTDPEDASFQATFTEVNQGQGDYVRLNTTINGQVYQWVEPVNGIPQGNYSPIRVVPTPLLQQLITTGLAYNVSQNTQVYSEFSFSKNDLNRYSSIDNEDNQGNAFKVGYRNKGEKTPFLKEYQWLAHLDYEQDSRFFKPIDRFRSIEFNRNWSLQQDTSQFRDRILTSGIGIQKNQDNQWLYNFSWRERGHEVSGWQQTAEMDQEFGRFILRGNLFLLNSRQNQNISTWSRLHSDIGYRFWGMQTGYRYIFDKNKIFKAETDSVLLTAMNFDEHVVYLQTQDSSAVRFGIDYSIRYDNLPVEGKLQRNLESQTANLRFSSRIQKTQQINLMLTYRTVNNLLDSSQNALTEDNIMGRLDWNGYFLNKHIRSELTFATSTGRELRREFVFLQVQTGQGTHTWRDENEDGVQDLNEFYLAINPDERNYIKVFTPTNEYIQAFSNNFSYRLHWSAPRHWRDKKGIKGMIGKFSSVSAWTINKRFTEGSVESRLIPFYEVQDGALLSNQETLRSTLFFNRTNPSYGIELIFLNTRQKQLLTNGFESRDRLEYQAIGRSNLGNHFNFRLTAGSIEQKNQSDFLLTRNYTIQSWLLNPEIAFQPSNHFRISTGYHYSIKENIQAPENPENAQLHQFTLEIRWNKANKRSLLLNARYINILYEGEQNTPVSYDMLEALQPGTNWTWSVNWQQRLTQGLQLILNYEGRRSGDNPIVNIGRMQVTALF